MFMTFLSSRSKKIPSATHTSGLTCTEVLQRQDRPVQPSRGFRISARISHPLTPPSELGTIHHSTPHHTAPHSTAPHSTTLHHTAPHCTTLCHIVPHCAILCHTVPHCTTLYHTVPHCATAGSLLLPPTLYHTVPHCTTLHHTAPPCTLTSVLCPPSPGPPPSPLQVDSVAHGETLPAATLRLTLWLTARPCPLPLLRLTLCLTARPCSLQL